MRIIKIIILALLIFVVTGCHHDASVELVSKLEEKNIPLAVEWVKENVEEAEDITADLEYGGAYRMFYEMCNGTYTRFNQTYHFLINVDTKEFATDEYYIEVKDKETEYVINDLPENLNYENIDIRFDDEVMFCNYVMDTGFMGKLDELKLEPVGYPLFKMTHLYDLRQIDEYVEYTLMTLPVYIDVTVNDLDHVKDVLSDLEYLTYRSNWSFDFHVLDGHETISCQKEEDCYRMAYINYEDPKNIKEETIAQR